MNKTAPDLREILDDLRRIKEAVSRSDSIMSFIDAGGAVRGILLAGGLLIALFSTVFYYLLEQYGSFAGIPVTVRTILFVLIGLAWAGIGYIKVRNILLRARKVCADITLYNLLADIYTPRFLTLLLPNLAVVFLTVIFLSSRGNHIFIVPFLALAFGLLTISISTLFLMKEIVFLGVWLTATGLLTLFLAEVIHSMVSLGITFAAGFVLTSLILYLGLPGEKR